MTEKAEIGTAHIGLDLLILQVNKHLCNMLGYREEELLDSNFRLTDMTYPEDQPTSQKGLKQLAQGEVEAHVMEGRYFRKDQSIIWVHQTITLLKNAQGMPPTFLFILEDITKRKELETAQARVEHLNERIMNSALSGVFIRDLKKQALMYVNQQYEKMTGYSFKQLSLMSPEERKSLLHPDDHPKIDRVAQNILKAKDGEQVETEYRYKKGDGQWAWFLLRVTVFARDESGQPTQTLGTFIDISERKHTEKMLKQSEEKYRNIIEGSLQGILVHENLKILFVNQACATIHGYKSPEEFISLVGTADKTITPEDQKRLLRYKNNRLNGENAPIRYEYQAFKKDGSIVTLQNEVKVIQWEGKTAIQGFIIDVTERRKAQNALKLYNQRLQLLREIDELILKAESSTEVANAILLHIQELIPCDRVGINIFSPDQKRAYLLVGLSDGKTNLAPGSPFNPNPVMIEQLMKHPMLIIDDLRSIPNPSKVASLLIEEGLRSAIRLPLNTQEGLLGALNIYSKQEGMYSEEYGEMLQEVATPLAIGLLQTQYREQIQNYAENLEKEVRNRTAELQKTINFMAGREIRMAELKRVIRRLRQQLKEADLVPVADDPLSGNDSI